jgi:hypothetical protein
MPTPAEAQALVLQHLSKLGHRAKDRVTGVEGVIVSVSFDLYGCIQAILHPGVDKEGKLKDPHWFDVSRLEVLGEDRVMAPPSYLQGAIAEGKQGAAEKPPMCKP